MTRSVALLLALVVSTTALADDWLQLQGDALRSGNAPQATLKPSLGLVGALPLTDGVYAAPVISE